MAQLNCQASDLEQWNPNASDRQDCLLGQQLTFTRRKSSSTCSLPSSNRFDEPKVSRRVCACDEDDFECDGGFWKDAASGVCVLMGLDPLQPFSCPLGTEYYGSSGYRKIPMSQCAGGMDKVGTQKRACTTRSQPPPNSPPVLAPLPLPSTAPIQFQSNEFVHPPIHHFYFLNSLILMVLDDGGVVWKSLDGGFHFLAISIGATDGVIRMELNAYHKERAYFFSRTELFMTNDNGASFNSIHLPKSSNSDDVVEIAVVGGELGDSPLRFHPEEEDWLLFHVDVNCPGPNCLTSVYWTKTAGAKWEKMLDYAKSCNWMRSDQFQATSRSNVYCDEYATKEGNQRSLRQDVLQLTRSQNFYQSREVLFPDIIGSVLSSSFMVVAIYEQRRPLKLSLEVSSDGARFSSAKLPESVEVTDVGYTILDNPTKYQLFLDISANHKGVGDWGTLLMSNSNGSIFHVSLMHTNRNRNGFVDFEMLVGVEGVALANQVINPQEVELGASKKMATRLTVDGGATWRPLDSPSSPPVGAQAGDGACDDCHLHLHGFTDKSSVGNEMGDAFAPGMVVAVGNVGKYLEAYGGGDTFMSLDAGLTWRLIQRGPHYFEFGDHGALVVMISSTDPVDYLWFVLFINVFCCFLLILIRLVLAEAIVIRCNCYNSLQLL